MATSSITKNFVVYGKEQAEAFGKAIEESANHPASPVQVNVTKIHGAEALRNLMSKRKKANAKIQ